MPASLSPTARRKLTTLQDAPPPLDAETRAVLQYGDDLSTLTDTQRDQYYRATCQRLGLDPDTFPLAFCLMTENKKKDGEWVSASKLVLYSPKKATDQLRALHQVSIDPDATRIDDDNEVVRVIVRGHLPDGRQDTEIGAASLITYDGEPLRGTARANAYMRAFTKAKRRLTLSLVGSGLLDESEVEDTPGALALPDLHRPVSAAHSVSPMPSAPPPAAEPAPADVAAEPAVSTEAAKPLAEPVATPADPTAPAERLSDPEAKALWARAQAWRPPFANSTGLLQYVNTLLNTAYTDLRTLAPDHYQQVMAELDPANRAPAAG